MPLNRSFLFTPGNVARRVDKAFTLEADVVIVDLEDSVAVQEKESTRARVAEALQRPRKARGYVRVNAPSTPFCYGDLVATGPDSFPQFTVLAVHEDMAWLRNVQTRQDGVTNLDKCRKISGQPSA